MSKRGSCESRPKADWGEESEHPEPAPALIRSGFVGSASTASRWLASRAPMASERGLCMPDMHYERRANRRFSNEVFLGEKKNSRVLLQCEKITVTLQHTNSRDNPGDI